MRLATSALELKQEDKALEHLLKAYGWEARAYFAEEDKIPAFLSSG